jgi:hypothetical protein
VIEAHEPATRPLVITALTLEIVEPKGLQGRGNQGEDLRFNTENLHPQMVWREHSMVKALLTEPVAHQARSLDSDRSSWIGFGHGSRVGRERESGDERS